MKLFFRFLTVGVFNTLLGYAVIFACMYLAKMSPEVSNVVGYVVGLFVSYSLHRSVTFKSKQQKRNELTRFLVVFLASYASNFLVLLFLIHKLSLNDGLSQILAGVIYVFVSFLMNKYFVFNKNSMFESKNEIWISVNKFIVCAQIIAKKNSNSSLSNTEYVLILLAIICVFIVLFGPSLHAKFYIVEDHYLYDQSMASLSDWLSRVLLDIKSFQRFRPLYWLYINLAGKLFGTNPYAWHAAVMLWGVLTCYLFYISLRKIGADIASSFVFILLLILGGNQNWIWINLIPQETLGMLFTAISVWAIVIASQHKTPVYWDILALLAMAFAGFIKESFVILMPALLLLRFFTQKRSNDESLCNTLRKLSLPLSIGSLIFAIEISLVLTVFLSNNNGYSARASGLSVVSSNPVWLLEIFSALQTDWKIVFASYVVIWIALWFDNKVDRRHFIGANAIFLAWLTPQMLLYANSLNERYLFPAVVSFYAAIALGLTILLNKKGLWPLWFVNVFFLLPIFEKGVVSTTTTVGSFTADTVASSRMVEFLAQNVSADQTILIASDSGTSYGFEAILSLPSLLKMSGSNSPLCHLPIVSKGERSPMHILAAKSFASFQCPDNLLSSNVGAIIIVDKWMPAFDIAPVNKWIGNADWQLFNFTEPYYSFSYKDLKFLKVGEIIHKVLLQTSSSSSVPRAAPLITVDRSLTGIVHVGPLLDPPLWGLERDYAGSGSIAWIGQGDKEGLSGVLSSTREQSVTVVLEMIPGPSRDDTRRTVEFSMDNRVGQKTQTAVYESGELKFNVILEPGINYFKIQSLDKATISIQPNGDTRRLLVLLQRLTIREN